MAYRCLSPDFNRRFCEFAFTGEVRVDITVIVILKHTVFCQVQRDIETNFMMVLSLCGFNENDTKFMIRLDDDDDTILSVLQMLPKITI